MLNAVPCFPRLTRRLLALASLCLVADLAAQVSFTGLYSENFDGLNPSAGGLSSTIGDQRAIAGAANWSATKISGSYTPYFSTASGLTKVREGMLSLGVSAASDRALSSLNTSWLSASHWPTPPAKRSTR